MNQPSTPGGGPGQVNLPDLVSTDVVDLTQELCDTYSVSGSEVPLAEGIETALRGYDHLEVLRCGNTVLARTNLGRARRVIVAGHLDTVPVASNLPTRRQRDATGAERSEEHTSELQ